MFVLGWKPSSGSQVDKDINSWPGTLGVFKDSSPLLQTFQRPKQPIIVYEYEGSPFCRKVRDACVMLDLTVEYRPCPFARYAVYIYTYYVVCSM